MTRTMLISLPLRPLCFRNICALIGTRVKFSCPAKYDRDGFSSGFLRLFRNKTTNFRVINIYEEGRPKGRVKSMLVTSSVCIFVDIFRKHFFLFFRSAFFPSLLSYRDDSKASLTFYYCFVWTIQL